MTENNGYAHTILMMECGDCGFSTTTPADNILVKTGGFTCPEGCGRMEPVAKYEEQTQVKPVTIDDEHEHDWVKQKDWISRNCKCDGFDIAAGKHENHETKIKVRWVCSCGETKVTEHEN